MILLYECILDSGLNYTDKYPPIAKALRDLKVKCVLDGEIVVFNSEGKPDFDAFQKYNGHNTPIYYCVFDLLWIEGYNITDFPLSDSKPILKSLIHNSSLLKFSDSFDDGAGQNLKMQDRSGRFFLVLMKKGN